MRVHQAFAGGRADPDPLECFERAPGVVHRLHVEDRRGAAEQQLRSAEQGRPVHGFLGVDRLERPDTADQPVLEPQIVGEPAKEGLAKVDVGLNESRDDQAATAVAHLRLPSRTGSVVPSSGRLLDRGDPSIPDGDVRPDDFPIAVVQQHITTDENQVRGVQVVTRG